MRFVSHLIKGRFLFIPNDFDPQTTFFKCDKTKSGGVMLPWLTARQEYQIRRNTSHFTEHLSNLKDIRNSHSFQHVVPISTLYTDFLGISWPPSIASKNRLFRRSKIMRKLSYCCLIFLLDKCGLKSASISCTEKKHEKWPTPFAENHFAKKPVAEMGGTPSFTENCQQFHLKMGPKGLKLAFCGQT